MEMVAREARAGERCVDLPYPELRTFTPVIQTQVSSTALCLSARGLYLSLLMWTMGAAGNACENVRTAATPFVPIVNGPGEFSFLGRCRSGCLRSL